MQVAIFVSTPYQVLIAIQLSETSLKNKSVDLYILNHFEKAYQLYERILNLPHFENVYYSDVNKYRELSLENNKFKRIFKIGATFYNYKRIVNKHFNFNDKRYKEIFLSYPDTITQLVIRFLKDINPNLIVNYFEDGIGSYVTNIFVISKKREFFNHIFGYNNFINEESKLYLFAPTIFTGDLPEGMEITKIPHIDLENKSFIENINYIFNVDKKIVEPNDILYFEQPMDGPNVKLDNKIADLIVSLSQIYKITVKIHPRSDNKNLYESMDILGLENIPWEIFAMNTNIEKKVLIAYNSTALITNKILFNQEPIIIFLYEMEELSDYRKKFPDMTELVFRIKKLYKDSSKVKLPKNSEDLAKMIYNSK